MSQEAVLRHETVDAMFFLILMTSYPRNEC